MSNSFERARARENTARRAADEHRSRLKELEDSWPTVAVGSWFRACVGYAGFLTCFAAEYSITLTTLPFVLDIDVASIQGVLLAAAPPAAMAVFDFLLVELLERPWRRIQDAAHSWRKSVLWSVRVVALLAVVAGNLQMLQAIAPAREEAVRVKQELTGAGASEGGLKVDHSVISRMVLYVSIWVSIDGALLLMFAHNDGRRVGRRAWCYLVLVRSRNRQAKLERSVEDHAAETRICARQVADAEDQVSHAKEIVRRTHSVHLQKVIKDRQQLPASHLDRVNQMLTGNRQVPNGLGTTC